MTDQQIVEHALFGAYDISDVRWLGLNGRQIFIWLDAFKLRKEGNKNGK